MPLREYCMAKIYDAAMRGTEAACLSAWRSALLAHAAGDVIEVGAGTGVNLLHYPDGLRSLTLCEPERHMRRRLEARAAATRAAVEILPHHMETLPFPDASFDTAVSTLVLCSVRMPGRCAAELHRILRPGGRLLVIEHVADPENPLIHRWQRRLSPLWQFAACGCHLARETENCLTDAGFIPSGAEYENLLRVPRVVRRCLRGQYLRP